MIYKATIDGQPVSKSNSYEVKMVKTAKGMRPTIIKSMKVRMFEMSFRKQLPSILEELRIDKPFIIDIDFYFRTKASDIDNGPKAVMDCLQYAGAITNDNLCYQMNLKKYVDRSHPRIEFKIEIL